MVGGTDYETDFYSWSLEQAQLVRQGRWAELDHDNVAEEIESLARGQFNKLEAAIRTLLVEILKWDHVPTARNRSSILSIELQRIEIEELLSDNPGMRARISEAIARAYRRATLGAAKETELGEMVFPESCVYSFDEIMTREFVLEF
jgi:Domain of unknown function DUF29